MKYTSLCRLRVCTASCKVVLTSSSGIASIVDARASAILATLLLNSAFISSLNHAAKPFGALCSQVSATAVSQPDQLVGVAAVHPQNSRRNRRVVAEIPVAS